MGDTGNVLVGVAEITIDGALLETGGLKEIGLVPITGFYTVDGVMLTVRSSFADIKVEENIGTIIRRLTDQEVEVTINIAEGELANMVAAIPGSSINAGGDTVTLGGGYPGGTVLQEFTLELVGKNPAGNDREITLYAVNPTGEVGIPYRKGEVSVVPVKFSCLVNDLGKFGDIVDL